MTDEEGIKKLENKAINLIVTYYLLFDYISNFRPLTKQKTF